MKSVLEKQCSAVWRLRADGAWEPIHLAVGVEIGPAAQIAELFASICVTQLAPGTTVTARFGEDMIIAAVDDEGVLVSLKERGGNPIMVKTAMSRIETRSRRGLSSTRSARAHSAPRSAEPAAPAPGRHVPERAQLDPFATEIQVADPSESDAVPTLDFERDGSDARASAPTPEVAHRPPTDDLISFEDPSSGDWGETPDTGVVFEEEFSEPAHAQKVAPASAVKPTSTRSALGTRSSRSSRAPAGNDGLAFEIVFTDDDQEESSVVSMESARFQAGCTWDDVADYITEMMREAANHLGRSVTANYWREAINEFSALDNRVSIGALGRISIGEPTAEVTPREAEALSRTVDAWKQRASRAIGDVDVVIPAINLMPWTTVTSREEVP
jgi:hypothetical protein